MEDFESVSGYADVGLQTDYTFRLEEHELFNPWTNKMTTGYKQFCTPSRQADTCKQFREEVAEKWANDHILLMIAFQKFEVSVLDICVVIFLSPYRYSWSRYNKLDTLQIREYMCHTHKYICSLIYEDFCRILYCL